MDAKNAIGAALIVVLGVVLALIPPDPTSALLGYAFIVGGLALLGFQRYQARKDDRDA